MKIDIINLFNEVGAKRTFEYNFNIKDTEIDGYKPFISDIGAKGSLVSKLDAIELKADLNFLFEMPCARCTQLSKQEFNQKVYHLLVKDIDEDDSDVYIEVEDTLDLDELLYSDIILNLPTKYICNQQCKGICSNCGADLNKTECSCKKDDIDPRLEALRALLD